MPIERINMPQLGESVTEGTVSQWLVKPGEYVNKYDPIAEVMTDKVNAEVPSSFSGKLTEIVAEEGTTVSVGELMCYIEVKGSEENTAGEQAGGTEATEKITRKSKHETVTSMKKRYSPAVLKLAQEHDIDLEQVEGTGKGGRITRKDIYGLIDNGKLPVSPTSSKQQDARDASNTNTPQPSDIHKVDAMSGTDRVSEIPVSGIRKAIANNMVKSTTEIPHAWMMVEVDVTSMVEYRNAVKDKFKKQEGFSLTFFAFFVKAVAQAIKEFPEMNSSWAGEKIIQYKDVNISIAVANEEELYVPVIKGADEKSIKGIAKDIHTLASKAREGSLSSKDMEGGTFTVNNTGSFGSVQSMGVINHPQAAILQVESIVKRPVIIDNMFAARDMVNLCLSLDHRVLDGLICGKFMARIKELLENVSRETTSLY
ncbi:dihydrolipoamide acetyltransferase family protein [Sediminibacillus massiliensis]|uniref:dihydrolipoamide acetyltransferase family protein n=1 Tax=Sediminibacillus massiliensis TaxID=1926277 RepID=UPI0009886409|nr:dihydrolipoamide acetyltransferase family protein [Sediminibacillus massiliensis]